MMETPVDVTTPDGVSDSTLYTPAASGAWPGVVVLPDIFGVRPAFQAMAGRLAGEGFAVLLPNIYYRTSRMPVFKGKAPTFADEEGRARLMAMKATLPAERMTLDGAAYVDFLAGQAATRGHARVGIVGYCMTGRMAMFAAGARPERVGAAASFHGGGLCTDEPDSPHLLLPRTKARLYFGHATDDHTMPAEAIPKLEAVLTAWGGRFESELYPARHGWCVPDFPVYDEVQAERAWEKLVTAFKESLH